MRTISASFLAGTATNVPHAARVFARYLQRGVNMTLATDTCRQSMIEALIDQLSPKSFAEWRAP